MNNDYAKYLSPEKQRLAAEFAKLIRAERSTAGASDNLVLDVPIENAVVLRGGSELPLKRVGLNFPNLTWRAYLRVRWCTQAIVVGGGFLGAFISYWFIPSPILPNLLQDSQWAHEHWKLSGATALVGERLILTGEWLEGLAPKDAVPMEHEPTRAQPIDVEVKDALRALPVGTLPTEISPRALPVDYTPGPDALIRAYSVEPFNPKPAKVRREDTHKRVSLFP